MSAGMRSLLALVSVVAVGAGAFVVAPTANAASPAGQEWTQQTTPVSGDWQAVTYGDGRFVAVANSGTANQIVTSTNGVDWTAHSVTTGWPDVYWRSVVHGNGTFVAVGATGTGRVASSTDGSTWTLRTAAEANEWMSVTYGAGVFVAVSKGGTHRIMTSPDGTSWTAVTAPQANEWTAVTYAAGLFVAVAQSGTDRVMTSTDGTNWTPRTAASASNWAALTYGNGTFVATAWDGVDRVMTSSNGTTWTARTAPSASQWLSVTYGDGLFVAVSLDAAGDRVMTSPDGVTWTPTPAASQQRWVGIAYGGGRFVAVANFAGLSGDMMSEAVVDPVLDASQWTIVSQALPMPASRDCADVVDADYAWGTGLTGGWKRGWESWEASDPGVGGGWACTRSLVNTGGNTWRLG